MSILRWISQVSCVHTTHSTHAHFFFVYALVSSARQRHLVQNVLFEGRGEKGQTNTCTVKA